MSQFVVRSSIYNIDNDNPTAADRFLVDTNVWIFLFLSTLAPDMETKDKYQKYDDYILKKVRNAGGKLLHCRGQLLEIAHVVEKTMLRIYRSKWKQQTLELKDYRKNSEERENVLNQIRSCWSEINQFSEPIDLSFNAELENATLAHVTEYPLDPFDAILLECSKLANVTGIITDDSDLAQVSGQSIFTYNQRVIKEVQTTGGKVLARKKNRGNLLEP